MDFSNFFSTDMLLNIVIIAIPALICITIHELSHGYAAYRLGDNTAKDMGRLTLNPIKHIDIVGLIMILVVGFGWAKPVPVNMQNFKHPKWHMAMTAIAGPLSNIILAVILLFIFMLLPAPYGGLSALDGVYFSAAPNLLAMIFSRMALLSIVLSFFNMLPIPPLDGSKVLFSLLPTKYYNKVLQYERFGMILVIALLFSSRFLNFDFFSTIIIEPAFKLLIWISIFFHNLLG